MATTRDDLRRRGRETGKRVGIAAPTGRAEPVPGFDAFVEEVIAGGIWSRPGLGLPDRMLCALAASSVLQRMSALERLVRAALDLGLGPRAILEVFMQVGLYAGFVTTEESAAVAHRIFAARGLQLPEDRVPPVSGEDLDRLGEAVMAKLHGERSRQGYAAPGNPITGALYPSAIRYGYGDLWSRPGLDHRQRMLCAVAAFTAMGLEGQLAKFACSALNLAITREEVVEAIIQTAPYGGFPRALNGLAIFSAALAPRDGT